MALNPRQRQEEPELICEYYRIATTDLSLPRTPCSLIGRQCTMTIARSMAAAGSRELHFQRRELPASDVVLTELLSCRGPAAWLSASDEGAPHREALCQLSRDLSLLGQVLTLTGGLVDLVLVPRSASAADELCVPFVLFLTKVSGVELGGRLTRQKRVAVMLDLDATLLESEQLLEQPFSWSYLRWQPMTLTSRPTNVPTVGHLAPLSPEPHRAEAVNAAHWVSRGFQHTYVMRRRPGWQDLRACLIEETQAARVDTYVCSLGRPLYVQLAWATLDTTQQIIPAAEVASRVNSCRPDGVATFPLKCPAIGFGLSTPLQPEFKLRIGPLFIVDDLPDVWAEHHRDSVLQCEAYRPAVHLPLQHDDGHVLRGISKEIRRYHAYCYGGPTGQEEGTVAEVRRAAERLLNVLQSSPLAHISELNRHIRDAEHQGEQLWHTISLAGFLESRGATAAGKAAAELEQENTDFNLRPCSILKASPSKLSPAKGKEVCHMSRTMHAMSNTAPPLPAEQVLRPSSRQDNAAGSSDYAMVAHLPAVPSVSCAATGPAATQLAAAAAEEVRVHVSINALGDTAAVLLMMQRKEEAAAEMMRLLVEGVEVTEQEVPDACLGRAAEGVGETCSSNKRELLEVEPAVLPAEKRRSTQ